MRTLKSRLSRWPIPSPSLCQDMCISGSRAAGSAGNRAAGGVKRIQYDRGGRRYRHARRHALQLALEDLIADSVEYMVNAHCADAMVCISNCDKITPGMLNAAMRLNIPWYLFRAGQWKRENSTV